ncbi:hypothetical protein [Photobacterium sp. TY1-4]|uniref:hypothetical protein n=1 Tax=Photobacterium sp. TY1-4 TaxID=2899122 RepID=UPI0021BF12A9|nr:hypothetical protein [Photobacterium sp. TY1-4]UXI03820.1 hypothetical protein NH461_16995 [Photobacterium sp. TY1-4]
MMLKYIALSLSLICLLSSLFLGEMVISLLFLAGFMTLLYAVIRDVWGSLRRKRQMYFIYY